jgi:hypothetical protein
LPKIRTTIRPDQELDVTDHEADGLRALGIVLDNTSATTEQGLLAAAERKLAGQQSGTSSSTDNQPEG